MPWPVHVEVMYDADTQHVPLLITVGINSEFRIQRPPRRTVDWAAYRSAMDAFSFDGQLTTPAEVESAASVITSAIKTAQEAATTIQEQKSHRREELPAHLRADLRRKRELQKLWARTRCPRVKRDLNRLAESLSAAVKELRGAAWDHVIDQAGENDTNLRTLCRQLSQAPAPVYPLLDSAGRRQYAASDRAEILAEHLEGQFTPNPAAADVSDHLEHVERAVEDLLRSPPPPLRGDEYVSPSELAWIVKHLPKKKAPGPDRVPTTALQQLPRRPLVALCRLFNGILRTRHIPPDWKLGKVIVLPKPGKDRRYPGSYRPITLLSHIAKLFERVLLRRLRPHVPYRAEQFGFRSEHSTTLQLVRVLHLMAFERNKGRLTVSVFLDIEKAFDRVWHAGLLYKLSLTSTPLAIVQTVASFLDERRFYVSVEDADSTPRKICAGVPQGSCLSPCLYAAYTDDIPTLAGTLTDGEQDVELALFADDSAYFASSRKVDLAVSKMQRLLDRLPEWLDKWRMAVNVGKTAAMLSGRYRAPARKLQLRGQAVEWRSSVKYLGVTIDRALTMSAQAVNSVNQAKAARAMLRPVLASRLPLRTKLGIFKTYVRSRLTYAAPAWYALCSTANRKRLQAQQNLTLRTIVGAGRYVRNDVIARDLKIESLEEFVVRLARRMYDRADNGPHEHLHDIAPTYDRPDNGRPYPRELLLLAPADEVAP
ncbi:hypothetical protein JYU34_022823 [Plutella xylostella]|uniref:Reverse transcriptase domain-containing protein n=1 Tax=Plutella xylostella TaxID=51655 RepID=A0ABQ7PP86_PLUXY|nr:hypothetical protein JYU34_022823 [Plutella xylostella]